MSISCTSYFSTTSSGSISSSEAKLNLSIYLLKFNSLNNFKTFGLSHSSTLNSSKFSSIGAFIFIVPSSFDRKAKSLFSIILSLVLPLTSSAFPSSNNLYRFSIFLYS